MVMDIVKGALVSDDGYTEVDIPSGVTLMTRGVAVPARDVDAKEELDDCFNNLDVSFTTPMIPDGYRRLFGNRGLSAGNGSFEESMWLVTEVKHNNRYRKS